MPAVLQIGRYRFYFFSDEGDEPPHIHVKAAECEAKFWLNPVQMASNRGFRVHELNKIESLVEAHRQELEDAWNDHFSSP